MLKPKLLWVLADASLLLESEWREAVSGFSVISVPGLAEARRALTREPMDCALLTGAPPGADPVESLESLRQADPLLPAVVWHPEMRAAEAVRLIRAGAYHCMGFGDTPEMLQDTLLAAAEEKRRLLADR